MSKKNICLEQGLQQKREKEKRKEKQASRLLQ